MNSKYIGVFDSGLGGLTVVKELKKVLPDENIIYFGDTGRVPYGTRSNDTIIRYVKSDINFLRSFDIKAIIVACGTASTVALPVIKDKMDIPIIGVVSPTVEAAVCSSKSKRIAVLGTPGTIKSGKYEEQIKQLAPDAYVVNKACTLFVPIVENGCTDDDIAYHVCKKYLDEVLRHDIDTIILGCTHYPLLEQTIARIAGDGITLINAGRETARYAKQYLEKYDMLSTQKQDMQYRYYVSDSVDNFSCMADLFLGEHITNIEKTDIDKY